MPMASVYSSVVHYQKTLKNWGVPMTAVSSY